MTDSLHEGDLVMLTEESHGVPFTGRTLVVQGVEDDDVFVLYRNNSKDIDPAFGEYTVEYAELNEYYTEDCISVNGKQLKKL